MKKWNKDQIWPELFECKCLKTGTKIYYFAINFNALCQINLETGVIEAITGLEGEYFDEKSLVTGILEYKNHIICAPYAAKHLYLIDITSEQEIRQIVFEKDIPTRGAYYNVYVKDKECYLFPFIGSDLLQLDLERKKIVKVVNVREEYNKICGVNYSYFSHSGCYLFENKLYMILCDTDVIMECELGILKIRFYKLDGDSPSYVTIAGYREHIYAFGSDGKIYIWNINKQKKENTIKLVLTGGENERFRYSVKNGDYIYFFQCIPSDEFIRINVETCQGEVLSAAKRFGLNETANPLSYMVMEDGKFYFLSMNHEIYILDFDAGTAEIIPLILDEEKMSGFIQAHECELKNKLTETILEGEYVWTLENYIQKHIHVSDGGQTQQMKSIGAGIYKDTIK